MTAGRILIVNLTRLGDLLQTSPTVAALRELHPDAEITLLVEKNFAEVCEGILGVDRIEILDLDRLGRLVLEGGTSLLEAYGHVRDAVAGLRAQTFDLAFNFSSSRMSAVLMRLVGAREVRGWSMTPDGFRVILHPWARLFAAMCLHRRVAAFNLVDYYRSMAGGAPGPRRLLYEVPRPAHERADALFAEAGVRADEPVVALQLGASRAIRQWPAESFARLGRALVGTGLRVALVGGPGERGLAGDVAAAIGAPVVDACGRTSVAELGAVLARARLLVTGDTGPMHMAAAVGTPIVALFFGPALPFDTGPYGADHVLLHARVPCAPCEHSVACLDPFCRQRISPDAVARVALARLDGDWRAIAAVARETAALRIYRTGFDAHGFFDCVDLGVRSDREDALRRAYRATWLALLAGAPAPEPLGSGVDPAPFAALEAMGVEGEAIATRLVELAGRPDRAIAPIECLGRELEVLDRQIEEHGGVYPETAALGQMFRFGKENLEGADLAALAAGTARLYGELARAARCIQAALGEAAEPRKVTHATLHQ